MKATFEQIGYTKWRDRVSEKLLPDLAARARERGAHAELMASGGPYSQLYRRQFAAGALPALDQRLPGRLGRVQRAADGHICAG